MSVLRTREGQVTEHEPTFRSIWHRERRLPLTHAVVSSVDLHVFRWTHACVVAQSVVAGARSTDANVRRALINVFT